MSEARQKLLSRVTELIDRALELNISAPQDTGYFAVDPESVESIQRVLRQTVELLSDIGEYFEERLEPRDVDQIEAVDDTDFLREIGASISTELASRELADLAFIGCSEIHDIRRELAAAVEKKNFWKIVAHADAGLGRSTRALVPIESAMREYEGLPAMLRRWEHLGDSLEIRRQYGMLWRAVRRAGEPEGSELEVAIRKIGRRIAILRRLKIYPFLRIDDRLAIRRLQKRILAYLQDLDTETGRRLWADIVSSFGLLRQINNRQELVEHDRQLILAIHFELERKVAGSERVPSEILERLEALLGRDDELDRVLRHPEAHRGRDCLAALARLRDELLQADARTEIRL